MPVIMEAFPDQPQPGRAADVGLRRHRLPAGIAGRHSSATVAVQGDWALLPWGFMVVGSLIGVAAGTVAMLLFSRVVEGVGMGLIAVVAPAAIAGWFPRERQGTPMGVWGHLGSGRHVADVRAWPLAGCVGGWQSVWWFGAIFAVAAFVLYLLLMREPQQGGI